MKKSAIVLGGSIQQLPLIKNLKNKGFRIVLVDYTSAPYSRDEADIHYKESTFDLEATLRIARIENPDVIATMATDQPVYTAAYVSEKLNIPYPLSADQGFAVTNKSGMKDILYKNNIDTPRSKIISSKEDFRKIYDLNFPLVVKPADSQGQRGITVIKKHEEFTEAIDNALKFSRSGKAIIEEFCMGTEYTANSIVKDGKAKVLLFTKRNHYDDSIALGVCSSHSYIESELEDSRLMEAEQIAQKITDAFKLIDTPLYIQMILSSNGWKIIEFGCRIGGGFESYLIPEATGFDIVDAFVDQLLGKSINTEITIKKKFASANFVFCKPGTINGFSGADELLKGKIIDHFLPMKNKGDSINSDLNGTSRVACYIVTDNNMENYERKLEIADKRISVYDNEGRDLRIRQNIHHKSGI